MSDLRTGQENLENTGDMQVRLRGGASMQVDCENRFFCSANGTITKAKDL